MQDGGQDSSMSGMFAGLLRSIGDLVRAEINLATSELTGKASRIGKDVGSVAVGGAIAYAGLLVLLGAAIRVLEAILPRWLAAFLVGLLTAGGGAFLIQQRLQALKHADLAPQQTIDTLKKLGE